MLFFILLTCRLDLDTDIVKGNSILISFRRGRFCSPIAWLVLILFVSHICLTHPWSGWLTQVTSRIDPLKVVCPWWFPHCLINWKIMVNSFLLLLLSFVVSICWGCSLFPFVRMWLLMKTRNWKNKWKSWRKMRYVMISFFAIVHFLF